MSARACSIHGGYSQERSVGSNFYRSPNQFNYSPKNTLNTYKSFLRRNSEIDILVGGGGALCWTACKREEEAEVEVIVTGEPLFHRELYYSFIMLSVQSGECGNLIGTRGLLEYKSRGFPF